MIDLLKVVLSSFWTWLGTMLLIELVLVSICRVINRIIRNRNIAARGWPPSHLDADGDWKPEPKEDSE